MFFNNSFTMNIMVPCLYNIDFKPTAALNQPLTLFILKYIDESIIYFPIKLELYIRLLLILFNSNPEGCTPSTVVGKCTIGEQVYVYVQVLMCWFSFER